jgi:hypothetical protein
MYLSLFKTLCMTEKQKDKLHELNFYVWFMVSVFIGLGLFADLIYYLVNK